MNHAPLRILHCPDTVGAYGYHLASIERRLGQHSWSVAFQSNAYDLPCDEYLWRTEDSRVYKEWQRLRLLWRALRDFDVIHFNYGRTITSMPVFAGPGERLSRRARLRNGLARLFDMQDLKLFRAAGKTIVMSYQGDDARQEASLRMAAAPELVHDLPAGYYTPAGDAYKRWRIAQVARYADVIYALNPDLLRVLPPHARFVPYPIVDPRAVVPCLPAAQGLPLVLHAPTHRGIKGTRIVLDAVRRLQAENTPFRFQLVEGLTRESARALYPQADLLVDQLVVGWYGGLALEMMALGKPVVCYIDADDLARVPAAMRAELPIIRASHLDLYDVLKQWLTTRRHELPEVGRRSRAFAERWHDPVTIVTAMIEDYRQARRNRAHGPGSERCKRSSAQAA